MASAATTWGTVAAALKMLSAAGTLRPRRGGAAAGCFAPSDYTPLLVPLILVEEKRML